MDANNTWHILKLVKNLIIENNGLIFGGFVRDSIIHDHFSTSYYKKNEESSVTDEEAKQKYTIVSYMPETLGRLVVPNDIDCFMVQNDYNMFINSLKDHRLKCTVLFNRTASEYINGFEKVNEDSLKHRRIHVQVDVNHVIKELYALPIKFDRQPLEQQIVDLIPPAIVVDVITSLYPRNDPFLTDLDFECNGLYMSKHGLSICSSLSKGLSEYNKWVETNRIVNDIISRVAIYMHPDGTNPNIAKRANKFIERGWKIEDFLRCMTSVLEKDYDGYCIICHENLPEVHFKLTCCDARYHGHCLKRVVVEVDNNPFKKECVMCKAGLPIQTTHGYLFELRD
jgi:hypothetical protein